MSDGRSARLKGAAQARYENSATPQAIEADLAVLTALIPRRQQRRTLLPIAGLAALVIMPFIGCSQSSTAVGGGVPFIVFTFLGIVMCVASFALRGTPIALRTDKLETARGLLRRIDFAAGQPVTMSASFAMKGRLVKQDYHAAGARSASYVKVFEDAWLSMQGHLSNGIAVQLSRSTIFGREETAHSAFDTATTCTETVHLLYPPNMNPSLASYGAGIAQHIPVPGAKLESLLNEPGSFAIRVSYDGPTQNRPEPLAMLLSQAVALVDRSRSYVQVDRDAWPPHVPSASEVSAAKV